MKDIKLLTLSIILWVKLFMFKHRLQENIFLWTLFCIRDLFIGINYVAAGVIAVFFPLVLIVNYMLKQHWRGINIIIN